MAVPEVDRHPLYVAYYSQLERENSQCLLRASARNKMKRFITDVHTVWLTNLAHHPEHRDSIIDGDGDNDGGGQTRRKATSTRRGLNGARESAAIAASCSQIQSVNLERAFRNAVFFAKPQHARGTQERGQGKRNRNGTLEMTQCHPEVGQNHSDEDMATAEAMVFRYADVDSEGGASPELSGPRDLAPTLFVMVWERPHITPVVVSNSKRRSMGGGTRRSAGGGTASGSKSVVPDSGKRMLRVLRFTPACVAGFPNPTTSVSASAVGVTTTGTSPESRRVSTLDNAGACEDNEEKHDRSGRPMQGLSTTEEESKSTSFTFRSSPTPSLQKTLSASAAPTEQQQQAAVWMISSYNPYDGSEVRFAMEDDVVTTAVRTEIRGGADLVSLSTAAAKDNVSERLQHDNEETLEGGRCLLLRKGVRVPVIDRQGREVGDVVSVLEVRLIVSDVYAGGCDRFGDTLLSFCVVEGTKWLGRLIRE